MILWPGTCNCLVQDFPWPLVETSCNESTSEPNMIEFANEIIAESLGEIDDIARLLEFKEIVFEMQLCLLYTIQK